MDELEEKVWRTGYFDLVVYLEGLTAFYACGMSGREATWAVGQNILYAEDRPTFTTHRKFSGTGVAVECLAWSGWLTDVLGIYRVDDGHRVPVPLAEVAAVHPPPGPRDFGIVQVWPGLATGSKGRRRGRAR